MNARGSRSSGLCSDANAGFYDSEHADIDWRPTTMLISRWIVLAFLALMAQAPTPQFRSGIDIVRFDVVVVDKARHPVAGLTAADFHVSENGKPLRIAGFESVTIPGPAAGGDPTSGDAGATETVSNERRVPRRLVVILFDRTIGYEWPVVNARAVANAAIDALGPNDLAAVMFTPGLAAGRPQGFTANRARLRAAVASMVMGTPTEYSMSFEGLKPSGMNLSPGESLCGLATVETLTNVSDSLATIDGVQKMILFIGGDVTLSEQSAQARAPECRGRMTEPYARLFRAVDRANVTVHAIDPRGLDTQGTMADNTPPEDPDDRMTRQNSLGALPAYTGGRVIAATNEPVKMVPGLFEESRSYYVLAIEREPARGQGQPHGVKIDVGRKDVTVLSRRAYFDAAPVTARKAAADPLERAIGELLPHPDLPLTMTLRPAGRRGAGTVEVTLATPRSSPARAEVLVAVFDSFAKRVGGERATVELPARSGSNVEWKMHLNPKPGHYEIRAAVRIGAQIGSIIGYVDVPK